MEIISVIITQGDEIDGKPSFFAHLYDTTGAERAVLGPFDSAAEAERAARGHYGY